MSAVRPLAKISILIFFAAYLVLGLAIFKDYGVHVDEYHNQDLGHTWSGYVRQVWMAKKIVPPHEIVPPAELVIQQNPKSGQLRIPAALCHGPLWEMVLAQAKNIFLGETPDARRIILLRHLLNFLLFYLSAIVFYLLSRRIFRNWPLALGGVVLYILHPRIFADAFYNTVDVAFLSFFTIALYTLVRFLEKKDLPQAVWHAAACAAAVDVRVAGLLLPVLTIGFLVLDSLEEKQAQARGRLLGLLGIYLLVFSVVMVIFWPLLWSAPIHYFIESVKGGIFNRNQEISPAYNLFWIGVTTPPVYLLFFVLGLFAAVNIGKEGEADILKRRALFSALFLFLAPLALSIFLKTYLYDGWRHHYFVYPSFVIVCLFGIEEALIRSARAPRLKPLALGILVLALANTAYAMARIHPFQFSYANILAGRNPDNYRDYWAVSARAALEYIIANERQPEPVNVAFLEKGSPNLAILPSVQAARLRQVHDLSQTDYLIVNYAYTKTLLSLEYQDFRLIHTIKAGDVPILFIYKKTP
jgi:hypothetical protein